jgi:hypothetical protein
MTSGSLTIGKEDLAALRPEEPSGPRAVATAKRGLRAVRTDRQLAFPVGVLAAVVLFAAPTRSAPTSSGVTCWRG